MKSFVALLLSVACCFCADSSRAEVSTIQNQEAAEARDAAAQPQHELDRGLIAHWPLAGDFADHSALKRAMKSHGTIDLTVAGPGGKAASAAEFNGRDTYLEVSSASAPSLGKGDFSVAAWINCPADSGDLPGDILSLYDPAARRGFQLTLKTNAGVTSNQANWRHLQFGIDDNRQTEWSDRGRPGNALLAFALVAYQGRLYAGTCESGADEAGHVYRYEENGKWSDCGSPAACNAVTAMAEYHGQLYAGVGKYRLAGSALEESKNTRLGGKIFRYEGGTRWTDCGQLPGVEAVGGMVVFRDRLYAASLYKPAGFFRYEDEGRWTVCETPGKRVEALGVYNGHLYATSYDGGRVYRFDSSTWTDCGQLGADNQNSQTYSFAVHAGRLFVGTWPSGRVYRFEDVNHWSDVGRLGEEMEVMGMLTHNGRLIAGTLPLAEVYSYDGDTRWRRLAQLDNSADVKYRRAWTLAEYRGEVFCSTLPSGKVFSWQAGKMAAWNESFPPGWHHVAAVKRGGALLLYCDGREVARSDTFNPADYDLNVARPLRIGSGANDFFSGQLSEVRLYGRELTDGEIRLLATPPARN